MPTKSKIVFAGLDEAGKTSLVLSLQKKFSFLNCLKPTFGLNRTSLSEIKCLGLDLVSWDLGGQKKFRDEYFKQKYRVFSSISTAFYLIDIQGVDRYSEALEYFTNILQTFDELHESPYIIICFNKVDPDIRSNPEVITHIQQLTEQIRALTTNRFKVAYYNTTIFDLSSIIKAFSEGVIKDSPKAKIISDYLKEYARMTFSSAVLLLDENSLMVGNYSSKPQYIEICEMVAPRLISAMEQISTYSITPENIMINLRYPDANSKENEEQEAMVFAKSLSTIQNVRFHIVALARNKNTYKLSEKYLPELAIHLSELIQTLNPA